MNKTNYKNCWRCGLMIDLKKIREITAKAQVENQVAAEKSRKADENKRIENEVIEIMRKEREAEEKYQKILNEIPIKIEEAAKNDSHQTYIMTIEQREVDHDCLSRDKKITERRLKGISKKVFQYCRQNKLNPRIEIVSYWKSDHGLSSGYVFDIHLKVEW